jgi:uncharacterized membrane protein YjjP (DUF1212 family)
MPDIFYVFLNLLQNSNTMVWVVAGLLALVAGTMLDNITEDTLFSVVVAVSLFFAIMFSHVAFTYLGVVFTSNRDSNIVVAAGVAICSLTVIAIIIIKILYSMGQARNAAKTE